MKGAEPTGSRGCERDASAAEAKRRRDAQRVRRYRERQARCERVGRVTITEDLVTALVVTGTITEREAMTLDGIEQGVNAILGRFCQKYST